jgi:O-antigen/teichoic acid export membrane protein
MSAIEPADAPAPAEAQVLSTPQAGPLAVRGGVMRLGAFFGGSLFSVGAAALLFRHLGVTDTGRYTTAMSLGAFVMGLTDLGMTAIGTRELAVLRGEQRARLARNLLGMRLVLTFLGGVVITSFAFVVYGRLLGLGVLIACGGVLIQNSQAALAVPLMARLRLGWMSALELMRQVSTAAIVVLLVLAGAHLLVLLSVSALAGLVVLPPTIALVRGDIPIRPSFDVRQWRALIGPVLVYSAAAITGTLYLRIVIVLVSLICSSHQLGYYSVSFRVAEALLAIPGLLVGAAFPIFAHAAQDDPVRLGYALSRVFEVSLIIGVWVTVSLAVGARLAIEVIGGSRFLPASPVLAVQGLAVGAVFVTTVWSCGLLSLHLHKVILIFSLSSLALVVVAVAILASLWGAEGAAIATALVEIAAAIAGAAVLARGRPHLRPSLRVLPRVAVAALVAVSPMLLTGAPIMLRVALSTLLYAAVLLLTRAIPADLPGLLIPARARRA